jgi:ABC-type glycerol-3-phosphate transport system substrate-binding protein
LVRIPFDKFSEQDFRTTFADAAAPFLTPYGSLGVPFVIDPIVLYWNRDILNSAGFAQAPTYWDEVQTMAQSISTRTETGTITRSAVPFGQYRNVNNAKLILSLLVMQAGGSITERDVEGTLQAALTPTDGTVSQSSLAALRFYTEFADPAKQAYSWNASLPEARKAFIAQDLALYYGLASERPFIAQANPNLKFSIASTTQRRASRTAINAGYVYAFAFPITGKNRTGALAAAQMLTSAENAKLFSEAFGMPSAVRSVLDAKFGTDMDFLNKQAIMVRSWYDPDPAQTGEIFRDMIEETVSGSLLLGEAVNRAHQQLAALLDEYRAQLPEAPQQ